MDEIETNEPLRRLGARVRALREERGWTQAELSRRAGLSLRFLADVEHGTGNASVMRVLELSAALAVSPAALVAGIGATDDPVSRFAALGGDEQVRLLDTVHRNTVALVGLRGAGKSTVGQLLAGRLGVPFVEVDQAVEERAGLRLAEIFEYHGADHYRELERGVLTGLLGRRVVLATGGSVVTDASAWSELRARARTVWLRASPEAHLARVEAQGDHRPMRGRADALAELRGILAAREPQYARAELVVNTEAHAPGECAERVAAWMRGGASGRALAPG